MNLKPKPAQVVEALRDHGVPIQLVKGYDKVGLPWSRTDGIAGIIDHHTGTLSARGPVGHPTLGYLCNAFSQPAANMLIGRGPKDVFLACANATYHCGEGGPAFRNRLGLPIVPAGNRWDRLWGIEIDGHPTNGARYFTDWQEECTARSNAALLDLTGLPTARVGTHTCWTNGCHGFNPKGKSKTFGRKADTKEGPAPAHPGDPDPHRYNAPWWRELTEPYRVA